MPAAPASPAAARSSRGPSPRKSGTNVKPPVVVFKGYNFTQNSPPETAYAFGGVPPCKGDLQDSVLLRPSTRAQWFVCLQELESLAHEVGMRLLRGPPLRHHRSIRSRRL